MCDFTKNYYIYMSCTDPGTHFCKTSIDGSREHACSKGPHERYIVLPESCPLCCGWSGHDVGRAYMIRDKACPASENPIMLTREEPQNLPWCRTGPLQCAWGGKDTLVATLSSRKRVKGSSLSVTTHGLGLPEDPTGREIGNDQTNNGTKKGYV